MSVWLLWKAFSSAGPCYNFNNWRISVFQHGSFVAKVIYYISAWSNPVDVAVTQFYSEKIINLDLLIANFLPLIVETLYLHEMYQVLLTSCDGLSRTGETMKHILLFHSFLSLILTLFLSFLKAQHWAISLRLYQLRNMKYWKNNYNYLHENPWKLL
jgi:hypothetical protein